MDYTKSDAYVTHPGTGKRMHQDTAPITTMVTADDMNMVIWSLMQVLEDAGVAGVVFDPDDPESFGRLSRALRVGYVAAVNSIASLRAYARPADCILVRGYYEAGDGGGGLYFMDAADSTSLDNAGSVIVGAGGRRWKIQSMEVVSVKVFGAKGDGVTDDTSAIQAAIDACPRVFMPEGQYRTSGSLVLRSVDIAGDGRRKTVIRPNGNFATFVNDQSVNVTYKVSRLCIIYSDSQPGSSVLDGNKVAFRIDGASTWPEFSGIHDVEVRGAWWAYYDTTGTYQQRIKDVFAWNCRGGIKKVNGGTTFLFESVFIQGGLYGFHVENCLSPSFLNCASDQLVVPVNEAANRIVGCRSFVVNGWDAESNVLAGQGVALFLFSQSTGVFTGFAGHANQMSGLAGDFNSLILIDGGKVEIHGFDPAYDGTSWSYAGAGVPSVVAVAGQAHVDICASRLDVPSGGSTPTASKLAINAAAGARVNYRLTTMVGGIVGARLADVDSGTFVPVISGMTVSGAPTYSGVWSRAGDIANVVITINPNGGSTASTGGSTVVTGLPFEPLDAANAFAVSSNTLTALGSGYLRNIGGGAAYPPSWSASGSTIVMTLQYRIKA